MRREALTKRQRMILDFVVLFRNKKGYTPTRQDINDAFGFSSPNAAQSHLRLIARKGYVKIVPGIARGIVVL